MPLPGYRPGVMFQTLYQRSTEMSYTGPILHPKLDAATLAAYQKAMTVLQQAEIPFLVGGAYAFACYTGITRHTKDFDLFVDSSDLERVMEALRAEGFRTEITYPHWLAKGFLEDYMIDLIFRSGNGVSKVDEAWFERALKQDVLGIEVLLCPPEEIIWTKAFIMERERFDGADVAHLLHGSGQYIDWRHLLDRFGPHWRVLLSHLILFGFIYPSERLRIPPNVMKELIGRLQEEERTAPDMERLCQGTLLSREQYLIDIQEWGYEDARLHPRGNMTAHDIAHWTAAIEGGR